MSDLPTGTVTLLFTDIEESTRLLQQVGGLYSRVLAECRDLLRTAFRQWNGHEVDTQGDAFFVAFPRATDAVSAAVHVQRILAAHSWPTDIVLRMRIGIHTGEPERSAEGYVGLAVHYAARIMSAAHGGQILLSQTTRDFVEHDLPDGVNLQDMGAHRLKDLQHPSHLYQLVIPGLPADFPPLKTLNTHSNNLPVQLTSLIGREQEGATVQRLLRREDVRLLTLTGPGGMGKTRLGLQVAAELTDRFADGVYFVNLAPISDPSLVIPTIAQTVALKETANQPLFDLLKAYLRDRHLLLLLDNFEQVASAAVQVTDLVAACSKLKVIVTSREVLHVRGEHEFAVPPLAVPNPTHVHDLARLSQYEAVTLFISRAQAIKPDFQVTHANAPAVAEICIRLDGLPLAIELAAARIKLLTPQALLARLDQRLAVLTSGARDAPTRQQTLRNTIEWSYNLLDPDEQRLFRMISYFYGGCILEAAEAICTEPGDSKEQVLNGVASLIDKSLLQQTEVGAWSRLLMLETVREYALERLATSNEEMEKTWQAHALYYLELAEQAALELRGPQQAVWLERLEIEHDNLRAVMRWVLERWEKWHHSEMALRLGGALERFWQMRSHFIEGLKFLERALAGSQEAPIALRAKVLRAAASMALSQGDISRATAWCTESLTFFKELSDKRGMATSLNILGCVARIQGKTATARAIHEEALTLSRQAADRQCIAESLLYLADYISSLDKARVLEESLMISRESSDVWTVAITLLYLANQSISEGEYTTALSLTEESLALCQELGNRDGMAHGLFLKGWLALRRGDYAMGRSLLEESLAISKELGDRRASAHLLVLLRQMASNEGDHEMVRALQKESKAIYKELAKWRGVGSSLNELEQAAFKQSMDEPKQVLTARESATVSAASQATPPVKLPSTYPDRLTTREVEVLRLVAQGLTDAQIGEQLIISPRTVNTHLTSIYRKIGVSSRSTATRYAMEHHLI